MLTIEIVPQRGEFGCAKAVIQTAIKTKYKKEVTVKDPPLCFKSLGTMSFLSMANGALRENKLPGYFTKKTNVKFEELMEWIIEEKLMIVLFISRKNYPHFVVLAKANEEKVEVANPHGFFEEFHPSEFKERFHLSPRYMNYIEWMKGERHPIMDRIVRWGIRLGKAFGFVKSGTIYVLET